MLLKLVTGNGERESGNECTAVTRQRIQNGGGNDVYMGRKILTSSYGRLSSELIFVNIFVNVFDCETSVTGSHAMRD